MAITFQKREEKQRYLIFAFLIIILVAFLVLYFGFFRKQKPSFLPPTLHQPPRIEINFETLKKPFLKELLPFEEIKPFEGEIGRENPFLPY